MSKKHNCKHPERGRTNETRGYLKRLIQRGLSKAPALAPVEALRAKQERRIRETCSIRHDHEPHGYGCDGLPFPYASELTAEETLLTKIFGA